MANNKSKPVKNPITEKSIPIDKSIMFEAFKMRLEDVKVVIVGQDPYPQPGVATGLAFAVHPDAPSQPSLDVIIDELSLHTYYDITFGIEELDRTLVQWKEQGVLLMNASLTCDQFSPEGLNRLFENGSHSNYWRELLMEDLFKELNNRLDSVVFVFMGQKAQYYNKYITVNKNFIINTYHPVADYRIGNQKFVGSNVFNQINEYLKEKDKIQWQRK